MTQITFPVFESPFAGAIDTIISLCTEHDDLYHLGQNVVKNLLSLWWKNARSPLPEEVIKAVEQTTRMWQYFLGHKETSKEILHISAQHNILMFRVLRDMPGCTRESVQRSKDFAREYLSRMENTTDVVLDMNLWDDEKAVVRVWVNCCDAIAEEQREVRPWSRRIPWDTLS